MLRKEGAAWWDVTRIWKGKGPLAPYVGALLGPFGSSITPYLAPPTCLARSIAEHLGIKELEQISESLKISASHEDSSSTGGQVPGRRGGLADARCHKGA